jgi:glycosyltransferase involved in cell wall biosynthesis
MRILIDGRYLATPHETGIATYARNVSRLNKDFGHQVEVLCDIPMTIRTPAVLGEVLLYDPNWRRAPGILRYASDLAGTLPALVGFRVRAHEIRRQGFVIETGFESVFSRAAIHFALTGRFLKVDAPGTVDIAHWTLPLPIALRGAKNIYTIHDIIPLRLPYTSLENRSDFYKLVERVVETADHVIVVSETTRNDVLELFPAAADKMTNTFQSVRLPAAIIEMSASDLNGLLSRQFGLEAGQYFLFYAAIEPKKNLGRLIKAYLAAKTPYPLIIVGRQAWLFDDELAPLQVAQAREALGGVGTVNKIVRMDYLPFPDLVTLIRGARAVLFPSIYEGFGLPVLESMMCGTPILTSNLGSMRELATPESSVLVDPYNISDISNGIERLSADADLCGRLTIAGHARAEIFSWDRYAERLSDVYRTVAP